MGKILGVLSLLLPALAVAGGLVFAVFAVLRRKIRRSDLSHEADYPLPIDHWPKALPSPPAVPQKERHP